MNWRSRAAVLWAETRTGAMMAVVWLRASVQLRDVALVIGITSTMYGLRMVYRPAAWIFFGLFTLWVIFRRIPK